MALVQYLPVGVNTLPVLLERLRDIQPAVRGAASNSNRDQQVKQVAVGHWRSI